MIRKVFVLILFVLIFSNNYAHDTLRYLFLAHTYRGPYLVDTRIENLDKSDFEYIWLGGDICSDTFLDYQSFGYLDTLLRISEPHHYWSLGNHDARNGNVDWFTEFTGKKSYYADYFPNISAFVFDTNITPADCENLNNQYQEFSNLCDTIQHSSQLLLFFHWGVWVDVPGLPPPSSYCHSILRYWNANCDSVNTNFGQVIYPKLVEVQNRGVDVICIMGDMGASYKSANFISNDSVRFLGCGLNNHLISDPNERFKNQNDRVLVFSHILEENKLSYQFLDLDSLLYVQQGYNYLAKLEFNLDDDFSNENLVYEGPGNYVYSLPASDTLLVVDKEIDLDGGTEFFVSLAVNPLCEVSENIIIELSVFDENNGLLYNDEIPVTDMQSNEFTYFEGYRTVYINANCRIECHIINNAGCNVKLNNVSLRYRD
jgi:hypothetical protein